MIILNYLVLDLHHQILCQMDILLTAIFMFGLQLKYLRNGLMLVPYADLRVFRVFKVFKDFRDY